MKHPPSQTFQRARAHVFHKLVNQGATSTQSKDIEKSILEYTKNQCKIRKMDEIRWSDVRVRRLYIRKAQMIIKNMNHIMDAIRSISKANKIASVATYFFGGKSKKLHQLGMVFLLSRVCRHPLQMHFMLRGQAVSPINALQ